MVGVHRLATLWLVLKCLPDGLAVCSWRGRGRSEPNRLDRSGWSHEGTNMEDEEGDRDVGTRTRNRAKAVWIKRSGWGTLPRGTFVGERG